MLINESVRFRHKTLILRRAQAGLLNSYYYNQLNPLDWLDHCFLYPSILKKTNTHTQRCSSDFAPNLVIKWYQPEQRNVGRISFLLFILSCWNKFQGRKAKKIVYASLKNTDFKCFFAIVKKDIVSSLNICEFQI